MLEGRKILQQLVHMGERTKENNTPLAWDNPIPTAMINGWTRWRVVELHNLSMLRCYRPKDFSSVTRAELHAFSDPSQDAIGAAVFLRQFHETNKVSMALVYGQAIVSPLNMTSIPRLELCGACSLSCSSSPERNRSEDF